MTNNNLATVSRKDFFNAPAVKARFQEVLKGRENEFIASLLSVVTSNKLLSKASNQSIMMSAMKAVVLNLSIEPSLGQAYIVPYGREAQFQLGYKGLIQLAQRSGKYKNINSGVIYKSQLIDYNPLSEELKVDFTQPADEVIGYFASFRLLNGFEKITYWTKEEVEAHGKRFSKSYNNGPWKTNFDAMAQKTLLKQIIGTYGPKSVEMQDAILADDENEKEPKDVTPESVDDLFGEPSESAESEEQQKSEQQKSETSKDTSYPADEIPNFDEETGEIAENISFFEGDTTKIKD